jgi:hypothetical protein
MARKGLREIAMHGLRAMGPRMDVVFYLLDALRLFRGKSPQAIKEIAFEIGMLGKYGLDILPRLVRRSCQGGDLAPRSLSPLSRPVSDVRQLPFLFNQDHIYIHI